MVIAHLGGWLSGCAILALVLAGCAPSMLYRPATGPHPVSVREAQVRDEVQGRDIQLRIVAPQAAGRFPVIVFSHGAFCDPQNYARITDRWAAHGYVVVAPHHLDAPGNRLRAGPEQAGMLLDSRIRDLTAVADGIPSVSGPADTTRMAIAGHSFGGMLAMIKAGLWLRDTAGGAPVSYADPRFSATVVMSGVGPMSQMADNAFAGLTGPLLASGGTRDVGNIGTGTIYPWQWRMSPYTLAPPGAKYSLVLEDADHYLGGLICRADRGDEDDFQGVEIVVAVSLAFFDAYLREDRAARRFLRRADLGVLTGGRAHLERK